MPVADWPAQRQSVAAGSANKAYFPISDTAAHLDSHLIGVKAPYRNIFPAEIIVLLRQLQSCERGDGDLIWALNRVRRQAEHRLLVKCRVTASARLKQARLAPGATFRFFGYVEGSEDDIVFGISPVGAQLEYEVEITRFIAFGDDVDAAAGRSVSQFLEEVGEKVGSIIDALQIEAGRLRLL